MDIAVKEDNEDVGNMVTAAKYGKWDDVFFFLGKKPFLINCIPQGRAWATLHQAVYLNNTSVMTKLTTYNAFDALTETRESRDGYVCGRSTGLKIAEQNQNDTLANYLKENIQKNRNNRFASEIPFVICRKGGEKIRDKRIPPFPLEITMYKESLLDSSDDVKTTMTKIIKKNFSRDDNSWKTFEEQLHKALYGHCKRSAEELRLALTDNAYFEDLIRLYTSNIIYKEVNKTLARGFKQGYTPSLDDLGLGLYTLLLDVVIAYWENLVAISSNTYRGISMDITQKFYIGDEIMFTAMLSSSKSYSVADQFRCQSGKFGTMIVIDNSAVSNMRPRYLANLSSFKSEEECVYPIGAEFRVTSINILTKTVCLKLLK